MALFLSLMAATVATALAMLLAIPAAYPCDFAGKQAAETVLEFPIIVSPAALGAIILIFFNNPLGEWIQQNLIYFVFTFAGIVLAQFVTVLGLAVRMLKAAFDEVPVELETVARTLGASPRHGFFSVTLPLAKNGLIAALILTWAKALSGVAGSMALRTETLPVAIFLRLSSADIGGTVALILILVAIGLAALYAARRLLAHPVSPSSARSAPGSPGWPSAQPSAPSTADCCWVGCRPNCCWPVGRILLVSGIKLFQHAH